MPMKWRFAWALVLAVVAAPAYALGLGQIQVRSQYGEPFLAEIPIVSSDPSELRQLQARLASPDTFARIGLQPPQGLVLDLRFNVALDASGRPVIRVSSSAPVEQPLLTFLIEADWGQGRLVREYSALLDAPDAIAAPAQPPIQAPALDAGNRIERPPVAAADAVAARESDAGSGMPEGDPSAGVREAEAAEPAPVPGATASAVAAPAAPAAAGPRPGQYGPVQAGETLSQIVQRLGRDGEVSANQMMLALLRTNPGAFIGGNINLLREGTILRMPEPGEAQRLSVSEASAEVRTQVARWREMSAPRSRPADAALAEDGGQDTAAGAAPRAAVAGARLEIAPPAPEEGQQAGTRSGISAGGEGDMLRQELQETRETLAARDAEVEELKARLADLEQLQGQQQQLIELKDSELAAVQQRLASAGQDAATPLAQASQAQAEDAAAPRDAGAGAPWPWIGLGLVLLIAAALAWARSRQDRPIPMGRRGHLRPGPEPMAATGGAAAAAGGGSLPTWHGAGGASAAAGADPGLDPPPADAETEMETEAPAPEPEAEPEAAAAGGDLLTGMGERLELARAYVELGDIETARSLLQEVVRAGPAPESEEAARLLAELA